MASAIQSAWDAGASEVIVADGGSDDQTLSVSRQLGARAVSTAPGRGLQLNRGAQLASHDILLFLHADNWLSPDCGNQLQEAFAAGRRFCCFRQRIDQSAWIYRWIEKGNSFRARFQKLPYGDQAISATRELYDQVGGFDEIPLMEDVRFAQKASRFESPCLLNGPLNISSRRWEKSGPIRQTFSNWLMMTKYRLGFSPEKLAKQYNR